MLWLHLRLKSMLIRHIVWRCVIFRITHSWKWLSFTSWRFLFFPQTATFSFVTRVSLLNLEIIINSHKSLKSCHCVFFVLHVLLSNKNMLVCWLHLCVRVGVWVCDVVRHDLRFTVIGNFYHIAAVRGQLRHSCNLSS